MKTATSLIFALLLAFAGAGCADDAGSTSPVNANTVGGDGTDDGNTGTQTGSLVTIEAWAPDGLQGDFAFDDGTTVPRFVFCSSTETCQAVWNSKTLAVDPKSTCSEVTGCQNGVLSSTGDQLVVGFNCPSHMFVPQVVNLNTRESNTSVEVNWEAPGSWGASPKGTYRDQSGTTHSVETRINGWGNDAYIELVIENVTDGIKVDGENLDYKSPDATATGKISSDLKTIDMTVTPTSGDTTTYIFTLTE